MNANDNTPLTPRQLNMVALSGKLALLADTLVEVMELVTAIVRESDHE